MRRFFEVVTCFWQDGQVRGPRLSTLDPKMINFGAKMINFGAEMIRGICDTLDNLDHLDHPQGRRTLNG